MKKKVKLHTCALEHAFVQKSTKIQKHTQNSKKTKKNISFLKSISTLKFLTTKFLLCNIYQLSNDNINYVPKANLPKQNRSSWLFVQKFKKKPKKSKNPKAQKQQPYCYTTSFPSPDSFSNEQNCLLHSLKFLFFLSIFIPHSHNDV